MKKMRILLCAAILAGAAVTGCSRDPKARFARYSESGKRYMAKNDFSRAIIQFHNARRLFPQDAEIHYQLGLAYLAAGDSTRAAVALKEATKLNPKHAAAQLKIAQVLMMSNNKELLAEAEKRAEAALDSSEDPETLGALAFAELKLGKAEDAEQHLQQSLGKFPAHLRSSVLLATLKLSRKDLKGAEEVLVKAVEKAPKAPEPLVALARLYGITGRFAEAEAQLQRALALNGDHAQALLDTATLRMRQNKPAEAEQTLRRLSQGPGKEYRHLYGGFLVQTGRLNEAIAEFSRLAKADPNDRAARSRLVTAYVRARRPDDAEKVLAAALEQNPKDLPALLERASLLLMRAKPAEAQAVLTQVLRLRPDSARAHHLIARAFGMLGQTARQRDSLSEAVKHDPNLLPARIELSRLFVATNSAKTALDILNQAPESQKQAGAWRMQRNWVLLAVGDKEQARSGIAAILATSRSPEALLQDAMLKLEDKDFAGAQARAAEVLKAAPEDLRALTALVVSSGGERSINALSKVREHVSQHPRSPRLQYYLGRMLMANQRLPDARVALSAAIALNPNLEDAMLGIAQIEMAERKPDAARAILKRVIEKRPDHTYARFLMGNLEEVSGNPAAAIAEYRQVTQAQPRNVLALNNLAYLLADHSRQPDEALRYAQQAAELAPDNPAIQDTIGWIYYMKGLYGTAVPYLEKGASAVGANARRKYHLAMAYLKSGQETRGRQTLEVALKLDPNLPEAKAAADLLSQVRATP